MNRTNDANEKKIIPTESVLSPGIEMNNNNGIILIRPDMPYPNIIAIISLDENIDAILNIDELSIPVHIPIIKLIITIIQTVTPLFGNRMQLRGAASIAIPCANIGIRITNLKFIFVLRSVAINITGRHPTL